VVLDVGGDAVVYELFPMWILGYGWLGRAVLQLELKRWCIGAVVPEGGFGVRGGNPEGSASRPCVIWATRFSLCWFLASCGVALLEG
jgi:hypothetical protein